MIHNKNRAVGGTTPAPVTVEDPKRPYVAAIHRLAKRVPDVRAVFDHFGHVRTLTTDCSDGLFNQPMLGTAVQQARKFLDVTEVTNALGLRHVELGRGQSSEDPQLGQIVTFQQEIVANNGVRYPVRQGFLHVFMDANGKVYNVNSSLRNGRRNTDLTGIIGEDEAIAAAKAKLGDLNYEEVTKCELVFSAHNNKIEPVYEMVVCANEPRSVTKVLVKAHGGEVVYTADMLKHSFRKGKGDAAAKLTAENAGGLVSIEVDGAKGKKSAGRGKRDKATTVASAPVMARALLCIPDPNVAISKQVYDIVLDTLPDPKVLANDWFTMYVGKSRTPVKAKPDGTFKYDVKDPEFSAVVTFFALTAQFQSMIKWGMKAPTRPIPVFVEDRSVTDNAYFDPEGYEIHIGVGTGLNSGGLNRYIAFDLGVSWHENGHHIVFLQTPGNDLPGSEGGAMHESIGDVLGDLLMDWLFRLTYATQLGKPLGVAEVEADTRIIGKYALPPNGIRKAKNTKRTPRDKTGEVHDDGEISGGAKADLLVALIKQDGVAGGLEKFGRMTLAALSVVPAHRVTFRDLLNAYITADQRLNNGANRALIVKAFDDHGITLGGKQGGRNVPIIIVVG